MGWKRGEAEPNIANIVLCRGESVAAPYLGWRQHEETFVTWYVRVLEKYSVFGGRAPRIEFWMFELVDVCVMILLATLSVLSARFMFLYSLYIFGTLLPRLAVSARRLHDTGRSGWWLLIGLIPFVGAIILLVFYAQPSQPGPNQFGRDPTLLEAEAA